MPITADSDSRRPPHPLYIPSLDLDELRRIALCGEPVTSEHLARVLAIIDETDSEFKEAAEDALSSERRARGREWDAEQKAERANDDLAAIRGRVSRAVAALREGGPMITNDKRIATALAILV